MHSRFSFPSRATNARISAVWTVAVSRYRTWGDGTHRPLKPLRYSRQSRAARCGSSAPRHEVQCCEWRRRQWRPARTRSHEQQAIDPPADADMLDGSVLADSLRARRKCLCEHVAKA
jgi:hypothetical protein